MTIDETRWVHDDPDKLLDVENWWIERRLNCRAALNAGQSRIAYEIAVKHGLISGEAYVEAEFLAGWIALPGPDADPLLKIALQQFWRHRLDGTHLNASPDAARHSPGSR